MTTLASGLNNPNIIHINNSGTGVIRIHGDVSNNKNYLILDYYPKGDLFQYIHLGNLSEK